MRCIFLLIAFAAVAQAVDAQPRPSAKITPGKVIVPTDRMRRIWGELVSLDLKTRTGTFRNESNDEVMPFKVLPYAELLHHATFGDLQDFHIGERAIFRLHEDADGKWVWLTYIQDEMNFLNGHKEYYWVDRIDAARGRIEFTQANGDKSFVRQRGLFLDTDAASRYWKEGRPARFADIKLGDKLRTRTHGVGKGKTRLCWDVFLDDASLLKFQAEQQAVHRERMAAEGLPGYVDARDGKDVRLTLFQETRESARTLKAGQKVALAPAGVDRRPTAAPAPGMVTASKPVGALYQVTITLDTATGADLSPASLIRLFPGK
jgi:hypothetical protein